MRGASPFQLEGVHRKRGLHEKPERQSYRGGAERLGPGAGAEAETHICGDDRSDERSDSHDEDQTGGVIDEELGDMHELQASTAGHTRVPAGSRKCTVPRERRNHCDDRQRQGADHQDCVLSNDATHDRPQRVRTASCSGNLEQHQRGQRGRKECD